MDTNESVILVGHGSPEKHGDSVRRISETLHRMLHPDCSKNCVKAAYLKFNKPDLLEAIDECVRNGSRRIIVHPYFLGSGAHVRKDIPEILEIAKHKYPDTEFVCTESLGAHEKMAEVVLERIKAVSKSET